LAGEILSQMRQMGEFERQQQEQFQRDMEEQRRILEAKQREYKVSTGVSPAKLCCSSFFKIRFSA